MNSPDGCSTESLLVVPAGTAATDSATVALRAQAVATLTATVGDRSQPLTFSDTWAIFRLFRAGVWEERVNRVYDVSWEFSELGVTMNAEVTLRGEAILRQGYFDGFSCPTSVTG